MSERLLKDQNVQNNYMDEEYAEFEEFTLSNKVKWIIGIVGGVFTIGILYLFVVLIPSYYIPEASELSDIVKVGELNATLSPLEDPRIKQLGLDAPYDYEGGDDDLDNEESDEKGDIDTIGTSSKKVVERIILIGDIHGHYLAFRKLLRKLKYNSKSDHIIMLGDFISKGPDSLQVLDFAINNNLGCIIGNHEYAVLQNYALFHHLTVPKFTDNSSHSSSRFTIKDSFNSDPEFLLAKKLQPKHIQYINHCPLMLKLGEVPLHKWSNFGGIKSAPGIAVHAGIRWDLSLEDQIPEDTLEMRSYVGPFFNETTSDPHEKHSISWSKYYNKKNLPNKNVVYYGHDARRGLNLKKYTKGIDTGCDRGEKLTAMMIWLQKTPTGVIHYAERPVHVNC
ncbi:uncharacterized protein KQ657_004057 [Scheffersomyces spartinae]|uniref:Calcineurin-like phosphoesterase domain-containing protein n=1 Tax=Scheffersomyces spartinae TaxID=45513 RepID=A0A9P7VBQ4_9ASCO|nr:uncharacterized protein KQ657_004057 [Scheffersomyces spartinae]KAG7194947.1 hypothetical protein KQ657_004057 [Scheffersomyces spartinae]